MNRDEGDIIKEWPETWLDSLCYIEMLDQCSVQGDSCR